MTPRTSILRIAVPLAIGLAASQAVRPKPFAAIAEPAHLVHHAAATELAHLVH